MKHKITPDEARLQYEQFKEAMIKLAQILNKKAEKRKSSLITYIESFKEDDLENLFGESTPTRRK